MLLSIKKIFSNIKIAFFFLFLGITLLALELFLISEYTFRLNQLQNQHLLIDKIMKMKMSDPQMVSIAINGTISEINLAVKLSSQKTFLETFSSNAKDLSTLTRSLETSSETFQNSALSWSASLKIPHNETEQMQLLNAKNAFVISISDLTAYTVQRLDESITAAKWSSIVLLIITLFIFFKYRYRLQQIYSDIDKACALDTNGEQKIAQTQEIDFVLKRLLRRTFQTPSACSGLINPSSGLNNLKGLLTLCNTKKASRTSNTIFIAVFEIDQYNTLVKPLPKEESGNLFKKIGEIIALREQPLDITAHLDDDHIVCVLSRNSKHIALEDCEKILHAVEASAFTTTKGGIKLTLSGGFLLKTPVKSIEEGIDDALQLLKKAKESGGNRIAQLRDRADSYR